MSLADALRRRVLYHLGAVGLAAASLAAAPSAMGQYSLTVLHNNDGESDLLGGTGNAGSVAEFKTLLDTTRSFYLGEGHGVVTISSGDNFLPSPEFQASLDSGPLGGRTYFDAIAVDAFDYDAVILGNHDFDAGPDVLADFIAQTGGTQYLSSNLDFSGEAALQNLFTAGQIAPSTTVTVSTTAGNKTVGIIGATTENLPFITSPGAVTVGDVTTAVQAQVNALAGTVDHIIVASHLQGLGEDQALAASLTGPVDLLIAGGGDEFLVDAAAPSPQTVYGGSAPPSIVDTAAPAPGDIDGLYPTLSSGVPIVTTPGEYDWLGRITLDFDAAGNLLGVDASSNLQENTGFTADANLQADVVTPVENFVAGLAADVIATSSQKLFGNGDRDIIRAEEAALGNLITDAFFDRAITEAPGTGVDTPDFAFLNGGGIRDDVEVGDVSVLTTFDLLPFASSLAVVEDVTADDLKLIFENAYSRTEDGDPTPNGPNGQGIDADRANVGGTGRFLQVSEGVEVVYDITADALVLDNQGNVVTSGQRILSLIINDEVVVEDGLVVSASTFDIATGDFIAGGGDQIFNANYLSQAYAFTRLLDSSDGSLLGDQETLEGYLRALAGGDPSFDIASDLRYDLTPDGRITAIPEPTAAALLSLGGLALLGRRRGA